MIFFLGADHAGKKLKQTIHSFLEAKGYQITDYTPVTDDSIDHPTVAFKVSEAVAQNPNSIGILCCGSGVGMSIAANKVKGIRSTILYDDAVATLSRAHNHVNVICFGERLMNENDVLHRIELFIETSELDDRYARRVNQICDYEEHH